jgi:hypothetical protein
MSRLVPIKYWKREKPRLKSAKRVKRLLTPGTAFECLFPCLQCQYVPQTPVDRMCAHSQCTLSSPHTLHIHDCISMSRLSIESLASGCIQCSCDVSEFEASMNYRSDNFPISLKINQILLFLPAFGNLIYRRINTFLCMNCHCQCFRKLLKICTGFSRKGFAVDNNSSFVYRMPSIFTTLVNSRTARDLVKAFWGAVRKGCLRLNVRCKVSQELFVAERQELYKF